MERELARRAEALSLAAWRRRPELVHRVHGILWRKPEMSPAASRVLLGVVGCGLLAGAVELARCPQAVAFVAAPQPVEVAQADAVNVDHAVYMAASAPSLASGDSGVRMVQAKAILPASRDRGVAPAAAQTHYAVTRMAAPENEIAPGDASAATLHEAMLRDELPSAARDGDVRQTSDAPRFIVLTAYERVETLPRNGRKFADYDTRSAADSAGEDARTTAGQEAGGTVRAATSKPESTPMPEVVITRLILRIESAPASPDHATGSGVASDRDSSSKPATASQRVDSNQVRQPAVIPFGNGWLVLQL